MVLSFFGPRLCRIAFFATSTFLLLPENLTPPRCFVGAVRGGGEHADSFGEEANMRIGDVHVRNFQAKVKKTLSTIELAKKKEEEKKRKAQRKAVMQEIAAAQKLI